MTYCCQWFYSFLGGIWIVVIGVLFCLLVPNFNFYFWCSSWSASDATTNLNLLPSPLLYLEVLKQGLANTLGCIATCIFNFFLYGASCALYHVSTYCALKSCPMFIAWKPCALTWKLAWKVLQKFLPHIIPHCKSWA